MTPTTLHTRRWFAVTVTTLASWAAAAGCTDERLDAGTPSGASAAAGTGTAGAIASGGSIASGGAGVSGAAVGGVSGGVGVSGAAMGGASGGVTSGGAATSGGMAGSASGGASAGQAGSTAAGALGIGGVAAGGSLGASGGAGGALAGSAGQGTAGTVEMTSCDDGQQNGMETGVDCGGSCEPCIEYEIDPPLEDNEAARSACEPNGSGFMCPRSMLFTPYMVQAAKDDWNTDDPPFVYGVVGHDPDPGGVDAPSSNYASSCCQCYQLVFKGSRDGNVSVPLPKPLIVQTFNTYAGGPTAFDVYMAVGGHGNFNGCTENGSLYSSYPDTGGDWSGGVRATRYGQCGGQDGYTQASIGSASCQDFVNGECQKIQAAEAVQSIARQSCVESNRVDSHYHMNWNVVAKRVECPENLSKVTGCRLNSQGLPAADPSINSVSAAMAAGFLDNDYHTTTMEDCCRPTCAWPDNTENTNGQYSLFYSCDKQGNPYTQ